MSTLTVFRLRAQWIVIQILETLLWLSFIIMSSAPEVNAALVVFEKSMNMRVCSGNLESGTHSLGNPGSTRVNKGEILLILVSWQGSLESKESNGTGFIVSPNRLQFHLLESSDFSALWFFFLSTALKIFSIYINFKLWTQNLNPSVNTDGELRAILWKENHDSFLFGSFPFLAHAALQEAYIFIPGCF